MDPVARFRELHQGPGILLMPNAWDLGSARILVDLGFRALATTSGGAAAARGLLDGALDPDAALEHCAEIAGAVEVPVSGDLEDCFADDPADVVYAPGLHSAEQIRTVLAAVTVPLNVLAVPGAPPVDELAELGVRRVSVGAAFAFRAYAALAEAAAELSGPGTHRYLDDAGRGRTLARRAFSR